MRQKKAPPCFTAQTDTFHPQADIELRIEYTDTPAHAWHLTMDGGATVPIVPRGASDARGTLRCHAKESRLVFDEKRLQQGSLRNQ